ncbi:hypothetical protein [Aphanothece sacrum]|uniref:Sodium:solute symporter n=1 Tax=Aphanothece sacrum FPU1 TaxID=1920663 RepID=A0A401IEY3_APHSA|nr:hypothetical protein [Aphanothece sacrum]GBF79740.1 sodium:solute symporter [Aphanothece sacrum FPU1]GBF85728.1 sodium:solute symporter [Aphanothece sacrum FPU3]
MTISKIFILTALAIVIFKFIASLFGQGNLPWLNKLVTAILGIFITFELFQLSQVFLTKL